MTKKKKKKIIIGLIVALLIGGYFGVNALIKKPTQTSYVFAQVEIR